MSSQVTQYMPFFIAAFFPSLLALIGILINKHDFRIVREDNQEMKQLVQHFIDLHIAHEGRLSSVETKTRHL
jgi:hypothetical protein